MLSAVVRSLLIVGSVSSCLLAVDTPTAQTAAAPAPRPAPTHANVPYGDHPRQQLDFWAAPSTHPTPVLFFIHGGGWVRGDKNDILKARLADYLAAGISVVSINYRYTTQAQLAGVNPPVAWPIADAARALQFVRSKASAWNLDKQRIAASGGSAGACSSLWLAFHSDLADPKSSDPIARESTRLFCVAAERGQTTLDPALLKAWTPNSVYGGHAFGLMDPKNVGTRDKQFDEFLRRRDEFLPFIKEYSPLEHVTADDPPVYLFYTNQPALGRAQNDPTHSANLGVKLKEKLDQVGVPCEFAYPGAPGVEHLDTLSYLKARLLR